MNYGKRLAGLNGIDGKDGKDGYTPIKGIDYVDGLDGNNGLDSIIPGPKGDKGDNGEQGIPGIDAIFKNWTELTKELHPDKSIIGYNTEKNRIEFYIKDLDKWFYLWSEFIAITETPTTPYITEDFETMWFIDNIFNQQFIENFDSNWFIDNIFNQQFIENYQGGDW